MDAATRRAVRQRTRGHCEYCRLSQAAAPLLAFHIEHIRARQHGGTDDLDNLALACPDCNRFKGPNLFAIDPQTDQAVPLFNPREHVLTDHFALEGVKIVGLTAIGRAAIRLLNMNEQGRLEMRAELGAYDVRADQPIILRRTPDRKVPQSLWDAGQALCQM